MTLNKINLTKEWLKVNIDKSKNLLRELITKFSDGICLIKANIFSAYEVYLRAFTCLFSSSYSSSGSRVTSLSGDASQQQMGFLVVVHAEAAVEDEVVGSSLSSICLKPYPCKPVQPTKASEGDMNNNFGRLSKVEKPTRSNVARNSNMDMVDELFNVCHVNGASSEISFNCN